MLSKALITAAVAVFAITSNGTGSSAASDPQRSRQTLVTTTSECDSVVTEEQDQIEEFHQTYPLSPAGRVSLENLNGGVQIKVWDRSDVQIDAVKRAYRRERLAEAKIDIIANPDNIHIKTEYPDQNQSFYRDERRWENPAIVDYVVTVPRKAVLESIELVNGSLDIEGTEGSVKASSINGRLIARGLQGEARLSTINGQLQATFTQLDESKTISLQSVNGGVTLIIPSDANASVRASTVHGAISNDFGLVVRHGEYVGHDLSGQIGTGGPRIKLSNVNGGIRITYRQDGRRVSTGTSTTVIDTSKLSEEVKRAVREDLAREVEAATAAAIAEDVQRSTREAVRASRDQAREAAREAARRDVVLREAQREVERAQAEIQREAERATAEALRATTEAQRDVQRAQAAIQREQQREMKEQIRSQARTSRGMGVGVGRGSGDGRYTDQETKSFPVSGSPRVNIGTFDGSIVVHGWDKNEVMYNATKRADEEGYLRQITISTEQQGSNVSIIARSEEEAGSASLEVFVPRNASLHVTSNDGSLRLNGVSGDLTLRTGDGSIEVGDAGGQLQVITGDGGINVRNFQGQVEARTGDGSISLDGIFNAVTARTGDGSISLAVPLSLNFTVETNAANEAGITNEGLNMTEDVAPTQRVRRWRIGNGGKVFVLNTGDGRIVLRSR